MTVYHVGCHTAYIELLIISQNLSCNNTVYLFKQQYDTASRLKVINHDTCTKIKKYQRL